VPDDRGSDSGARSGGAGGGEVATGTGSIDDRHLLLVGAGPGLGMAVAGRFAEDGYRVTLVARSTDGLDALAGALADTSSQIDTISADASDPTPQAPESATSTAARARRGSSSTARSWELRINC